jgi:exonuclease 3'-5' domain-containing protein 2
MMSGTPTPINPYNDRPTVRLLDREGVSLGHVSQREAARLLRGGLADLILDDPPGVKLTIPVSEYQASATSFPGVGEQGEFLHARRGKLYGNVTFQGPGGEEMFHTDAEKALWYLNRGLVEVISREPPVLRFRFAPGGAGHAGDAFYLSGKENRCVVCGVTEGLNRHHIVPSVYRRHLPAEVKEHAHHDVVLLCLACHERYEREADVLKAELGRECGVPPHGLRGERDRRQGQAVALARSLRRDGERIPAGRREEMLRVIGEWAGKWPLQEADVEAVAQLDHSPEEGAIEHGQQVVARVPDVQAFVRRWREHFLRVMQPCFLSEHWDVNRAVLTLGVTS